MILPRFNKTLVFKISQNAIRTFYQELTAAEIPTATVKIKNAKYLPSSSSDKFPDYISTRDHKSLKIIKVDRKADQVKKRTAEYLQESIKEHAAILIKGFQIENAVDLSEFTQYLPFNYMSYKSGNGYRDEIASNIYTASEEPKEYTIELHNEMSSMQHSPSKLSFCCVEDAFTGGESPISFNRDILRDLDTSVYKKFKTKKIKYTRNLLDKKNTDYISWQHTFRTDDVKKAEEVMKKQEMEWEWMDNGDLCIYNSCEAIREHPTTKEIVWFNQASGHHFTYYSYHPNYEGQCLTPRQYPFHCFYGDGEEFEEETVEHLREIYWKNAIPLKLEKGDIFFMDNYLCAHSRMSFEGKRKILVNLFE